MSHLIDQSDNQSHVTCKTNSRVCNFVCQLGLFALLFSCADCKYQARVAISDDSKKYIVRAVLFCSIILSVKSGDIN